MKNKGRSGHIQQRVIAEAARLMVEQGLDNPHQACRKAAARLDYNLRLLRWMEHYLQGDGGSPPPYPIDHAPPK